jgi:ribosomal protein S18 acetylase RimI-like enzyme
MYQLRPATQADYAFLYNLHRETIRPSVEATWGWDEAWQQAYFAQKFDPRKRQVIVFEGHDVGVVTIEEGESEIYLALIEVATAFQGRGIGTAVIQDILHHARQQNLPVALHVLKTNDAAKRLYERLGFAVTAVEDLKYKMQCLA